MKFRSSKELTIGICVLISILILVFGINFLKGVNLFKASNYYYVTYPNVAGLAKSAPVNLNGFKVGLVRDISYEYDNPGNVRVELSLDKNLRLPVGTRAVLATDMLGTSTIDLELGASSEYQQVGDNLIAVNKAGLMESVTKDLMPGIKTMLGQLDSIMTAVNGIVSDPALANAVKSLDGVMADLKNTSAGLSEVMARMPAVAADIQTTMANARGISESAGSMAQDLAAVTAQIRQARLDSTLSNINSLTASLAEISRTLNTKDSSLGMLINDPALYNSLNGSVASLDSLLQDVKKNPKRYISIKLL